MLNNIVRQAKKNYEILKEIIQGCKTRNELVNKLRQKNVVIEEYKYKISIKQEELKIVVDVKDEITINEVLIFDENYEKYVELF